MHRALFINVWPTYLDARRERAEENVKINLFLGEATAASTTHRRTHGSNRGWLDREEAFGIMWHSVIY